MKTLEIESIDYHRNGVCGLGFHVAIATRDGQRLVIIRPIDSDKIAKATGNAACFVLDIDELAKGEIRFGHNSHRGDHFASDMDRAIAEAPTPPPIEAANTPRLV